MNADSVHLPTTDPPANYFDRAIECLMAGLFAFAPFAFGAVEAWSEEVVVILSGAMVLCLLLKVLIRRDTRLTGTWALVPLGLFLLLTVIQLAPLPPGLLAAITPNTATTRTGLAGGLSHPPQAGAGMTISFYPPATERALRLALAVAAVFVVTVNVYRRPRQVERLLAVLAVVGGAVALLALAQVITNAHKIYWRIPAVATGGPYVNRNNYCQFMNLSVGAALGLLLVRLKSGFRQTPLALPLVVERLGAKELRPVWYLSGMIVLAIASIFLSLSRGGMISLVVAGGITVGVLALRNRLAAWGWVMCALAVGAFACVLYVGFDSVYDRLGSLWNLREHEGRWQLARDSLRVWATFPWLGAGLGVHEYVYPMFDRSTILSKATYVENEYVQMAEETGVIGLVLVGAFGVTILRNYVRCIRSGHPRVGIAAIGLGGGLLAVLIHSVGDFGLRLPSIACPAAAFCGLLVAMARMPASLDEPARTAPNAGASRPLAAISLACATALFVWAAIGAHAAQGAEAYWHEAQRLEKQIRKENWAVSNADYARLIALTEEAARRQPRNVVYRHWLNAHRWRAVSRAKDPKTGNIILGPAAARCAERIVADLASTHALCPTFGPSYSLAGQLRLSVLGDRKGAEWIRRGRALAPCDPAACVADGLLDVQEGNIPAALATLRRAMTLDGSWFEHIVKACVFQVDRPDVAIEIAKGDVSRLLAVAEILERTHNTPLAARARREAAALLRAQCDAPDAPAHMLARAAEMCLQEKEYGQAAAYYRRALSRECGNVDWRLNFAEALAAMGQVSDAREQAGICLKLMPEMPAAKRMVCDLRTRPVGDYAPR